MKYGDINEELDYTETTSSFGCRGHSCLSATKVVISAIHYLGYSWEFVESGPEFNHSRIYPPLYGDRPIEVDVRFDSPETIFVRGKPFCSNDPKIIDYIINLLEN